MLLTLTNRTAPARDLGRLVRKHPDRLQSFELSIGVAHVVYPEATDAQCTMAMFLEIDPVGLVRGRASSNTGGLFDTYVTDRPYAISSFLSVAIARVLGAALGGRGEDMDLQNASRDFEATLSPVHFEDPAIFERLFAPLGYDVSTAPVDVPPAARAGAYCELRLRATTTLQQLLTHIYVLIPVLDNQKHYWVGDAESEKLLRHGGEWLVAHPDRELITRRYLRRAPGLAKATLARLAEVDESSGIAQTAPQSATGEEALERPLKLQDRRVQAVVDALTEHRAGTVVDLGCGEGDLIAALVPHAQFTRVLGMDISMRELQRAKERLERMLMTIARREQISLIQSSLVYADSRLKGFDAATLLEVIEHIDADRLPAFERVVFGEMKPRLLIVTTPNQEYNRLFPNLAAGAFRHPDHRFEWDRATFQNWAKTTAERFGYGVSFQPIGDFHSEYGAPTQMAVFLCK